MAKDILRIGNRIVNNPGYNNNEYGLQFRGKWLRKQRIQTYVYNQSQSSIGASYNLLLQPNGGRVSIGNTSPGANLHVLDGSSTARIIELVKLWRCNFVRLTILVEVCGRYTIQDLCYISGVPEIRGYISFNAANNSLNFTGQHLHLSRTHLFKLQSSLIVSDFRINNGYVGIEAGSDAVTINEALPVVSVSSTPRDKRCFGVVSSTKIS